MDIKKLKALWDKTTLKGDESYDWSELEKDEDGIYAPQGSTLGNTLIMLDDNYEDSGYDCLFISELIKEFVKELEKHRELGYRYEENLH